jgi:predicted RNase H-like HicB family nuclease
MTKEVPMRQVMLFRDEDGGWVVECPSLPGCISQGDTREEAVANIKEAIELYLEVLKEDGKPIPEDTFEAYLVAV